MSSRSKVILGVVAAVVLGLGVATGTVLAQSGSGQESPEPGALCDRFVEGVASQLGVTAADVDAAFRGAKLDMVDEAVASGKITAEQAAQLKARIEEAGACWRPLVRPAQARLALAKGLVVHAAAETLDMTPRELIAELRDCKSMADVAAEQGMSSDDLKTGILTDVEKHLDQAVARGRITEERADEALQKLTDNIDEIVNSVRCPKGAPSA
jgi:polyhydroxyalkanoate synthesis regulator phasin